ncbi:MAG: ubiquinol-cytochrome C chaperone family protein [Alphaproteobacteria bacterium]|jgi:cytochrome b pre-mRNA-processing protein 3|uniref:ubiquinol-cytochrome C chaperone family protein n=1 Tax=Methyloceanibacter sp. TaxID=1965321 RepID=UPI0035681B20
MALSLKPLAALLPWHRKVPQADQLYGAIVARARLPIFYQGFGVPDNLEGRYVVLSLHLFTVLHRLKQAGTPEAARMAQDVADRFSADMETVLRELGVGDMAVPKKMRKLMASGAGQLESFESALSEGAGALQSAIEATLPGEGEPSKAASAALTPYVLRVVQHLDDKPIGGICAGKVSFPRI